MILWLFFSLIESDRDFACRERPGRWWQWIQRPWRLGQSVGGCVNENCFMPLEGSWITKNSWSEPKFHMAPGNCQALEKGVSLWFNHHGFRFHSLNICICFFVNADPRYWEIRDELGQVWCRTFVIFGGISNLARAKNQFRRLEVWWLIFFEMIISTNGYLLVWGPVLWIPGIPLWKRLLLVFDFCFRLEWSSLAVAQWYLGKLEQPNRRFPCFKCDFVKGKPSKQCVKLGWYTELLQFKQMISCAIRR